MSLDYRITTAKTTVEETLSLFFTNPQLSTVYAYVLAYSGHCDASTYTTSRKLHARFSDWDRSSRVKTSEVRRLSISHAIFGAQTCQRQLSAVNLSASISSSSPTNFISLSPVVPHNVRCAVSAFLIPTHQQPCLHRPGHYGSRSLCLLVTDPVACLLACS